MIVLDEEIHGPTIARSIAAWYTGRVVSITTLRPKTVIKDEAIPTLLRTASRPTFVTINTTDFWRKIPADPRYCIVCIELTARQMSDLPDLLRGFLRLSEFKTKLARMGKVVRLRSRRIEYYGDDRQIHFLAWPAQ